MNIIKTSLFILFGIHFSAISAGRGTSIEVEVGAEMLAKIAIYYKGVDITSGELNFPLSVNSVSQKFANTSDYFYLVGNVARAKVVMETAPFELTSVDVGGGSIPLNGYFTLNVQQTEADKDLSVPVLRRLTDGNSNNGLKVTFESKKRADNYAVGYYTGRFTMVVTPIL
ncbi:hypothetical protein [Budvicia diplopodorum]|uniref:hypothetical protein n=1 Tax=Budvicia diplopodorum TaxID=1119056 RepID=UPI001358FD36|nr:hypothetical protein [Budvicia diplopodorum]